MKFVTLLIIFSISAVLTQKCHPECAWKCDDPKCDAICDPVCEPPKCHTSCQEPKNAVCDVKCEKPDCSIMCPDKACEFNDCPKCVTICKPPHCVTHCQVNSFIQVPKPICEAVCNEPKCDWKCQKPQCPKPKCELVCENPGCRPTHECCKCTAGAAVVGNGLPIFKEMETDKQCCACNANQNAFRFEERKGNTTAPVNDHLKPLHHEEYSHYSVNPTPQPIRIGPSVYGFDFYSERPDVLLKRIEAKA